MLDKRERYYIRHRLVLRPKRNNGAALALLGADNETTVFSILKAAVNKKTAVMYLPGGDTVRITAIDYRAADNVVILIFRRKNPNASTQVYEHADSAKIREADRGLKEDPAVSGHLFVQATPHKGDLASHRAIIEEVQGLGPSYMKTLIDEVVRAIEYDAIDSRGAAIKTTTKVDIWGVPSENLKASVAKNGFNYIEIVKEADLDGLDTEGMTIKPERMKIVPKRIPGADNESLLKRVKAWADGRGWSDVYVQVRENDKTKVVKLGRDEDAATTLFVRADPVKVATDIKACSDTVNDELLAEALKMFADDASWK
ncbi:hypothetical protein [Brevundimonas mediterranea]|uniref:DUF4747 family protein n=1 Tax=Brevundimonas mediterranea TaxID=74329 RepID=A0A7W6A1X6_9CAUL|nr:hypothetical protein [Brevundimonas mediterranea]MBB3870741.1 hypothetical protein [Brevundimonas mediterranea]